MARILAAALGLALSAGAAAPGGVPVDPRFFEAQLQRFVDQEHGRSFARLGEESDFDHAHLLFGRSGRLLALLYHTQELAERPGAGLDPDARNWLQWPDGRPAENARAYERRRYPSTPAWEWFLYADLPGLRGRRTVTAGMLDPDRLGEEVAESRQWVFTRAACGSPARDPLLTLRVPGDGTVCLALSRE